VVRAGAADDRSIGYAGETGVMLIDVPTLRFGEMTERGIRNTGSSAAFDAS